MDDPARRPGCPKRMVFGPCGGVRPDAGCEVEPDRRCVFVDEPYPARTAGVAVEPSGRPRLGVVTDLHVTPRDRASVEAVADVLAGSCDVVLVADHGARHGDFPPGHLAALVESRRVRAWVTLACRDRNRAALAAECAALADRGVAGVHCVTGDWQATGGAQVFDLDSLRLVEIAVAAGLTVSVAASPGAPPVGRRAGLLADKAAAGATVCFVNHCGGPSVVGPFVAAAIEAGAGMDFVACVPVVSDPQTAVRLARLPGLVLDPVAVTGELGSGGTGAAVGAARAMLVLPGVTGVNLSGAASGESVLASAAVMARVGREVGALV